jgi:hypothetical protein
MQVVDLKVETGLCCSKEADSAELRNTYTSEKKTMCVRCKSMYHIVPYENLLCVMEILHANDSFQCGVRLM